MFALYLRRKELARRLRGVGVSVDHRESRESLMTKCLDLGLVHDVHRCSPKKAATEDKAVTSFLETQTDYEIRRANEFMRYVAQFRRQNSVLSDEDIHDRVDANATQLTLATMRDWCARNGGVHAVVLRKDVPPSLRYMLWVDHVRSMAKGRFPGDIIDVVYDDVPEQTLGWRDEDVCDIVAMRRWKCFAIQTSRNVVAKWLSDNMIQHTSLGTVVRRRYLYCTDIVKTAELETRFGPALESVRAQWSPKWLALSMQMRKTPEELQHLLQTRACLRCRGKAAWSCSAHLCGHCCRDPTCQRHAAPRVSS